MFCLQRHVSGGMHWRMKFRFNNKENIFSRQVSRGYARSSTAKPISNNALLCAIRTMDSNGKMTGHGFMD